MTTIYTIRNNWDDRTLTKSGTWCNDGRDVTANIAEAEAMLSHYVADHPEDAERVRLDSYEAEVEE